MIDFGKRMKTTRRARILAKVIGNFKKGAIIQLDTDESGIPVDEFWRKRLVDKDVEIIPVDEKVFETKKKGSAK